MKLRLLILSLLLTCLSAPTRAQSLFQEAASGDVEAMLELSQQYRLGLKLPKNEDSASYWLAQALATGHPEALYLEGLRLSSMPFDSRSFNKGMLYLNQAADSNHTSSLALLAEIWAEKGEGTASERYFSVSKSFGFSLRAAEGGDAGSMVRVSEALLQGSGTSRNDSLALVWMERAAQKGQLDAYNRLGDWYLEGKLPGGVQPGKAWEAYHQVLSHRWANIDQKSHADIGMHEAENLLRKAANARWDALGIPESAGIRYYIRK